jgi:4-amino-4-deoxy-L-arabinose transferase-like glycosyltransferase
MHEMMLQTDRKRASAAAHADRAIRNDGLLWAAAVGMFALAVLSTGYLVYMELGPWRQELIDVDEMYFASCAARGLAVGHFPVAGCYDNKGPMTHLVYQLVQLASSRYDILAIKGAAFVMVALVVGLVAVLAYRLGGRLAAVAAAALALQALATEVSHMALKTETLGVAFVLAGLILLVPVAQRDGSRSRLLSGCLLGLAVVTKQTNLLVGFAVLVYIGLCCRGSTTGWTRAFAKEAALFALGLVLPFLLFLLLFVATGRQAEFLGSFYLFPSVYGAPVDSPSFRPMWWRLGAVLRTLAETPLLAVLFAMSLASLGLSARNLRGRDSTADRSRILVGMAAIALLLVMAISPAFFSYHVVPARTLMAVLGGTLIADASARIRSSSSVTGVGVAAVLLCNSLLMAANSWRTDGGKQSRLPYMRAVALGDGRGEYGYVLGTSPQFYFVNGLVPASNVMFPWAVAGAPEFHYFTLPPTATWRGRAVATARARGLDDLMADFRRTPPRYIFVVDKMARSADSPRLADVPGFDEYVADRCRYLREVNGSWRGTARVFRCRTDGEILHTERATGVP